MKLILLIQFFLTIIGYAVSYIVEPGPLVKATKGEIWPKPNFQMKYETFSVIQPMLMKFQAINHKCDILDQAIVRYSKIVQGINLATRPLRKRMRYSKKHQNHHNNNHHHHHNHNRNHHHHHDHHADDHNDNTTQSDRSSVEHLNSINRQKRDRLWRNDPNFEDILEFVNLDLLLACENEPYLGMDESYNLTLSGSNASIISHSIWGILRGMESFSQMVIVADDVTLRINSTEIQDRPRFSHRGLLLDTSRHFMNIFTIYKILDGMSYNKLNVFHWHIVDDQSFPYQSIKYPELSERGAYNAKTLVYTQSDIRSIIEYARVRGIRVMVEFDTPGHTRSWGVSHPEILTECNGAYTGKLGPMNPIVNETYTFMENLLKEIVEVFPDQYVHLGGDEVEFECWRSSKMITDYMEKHNITKYEVLEEQYIQRIIDMVDKLNASSIVWQEVFINGVKLPEDTVVHVWTGNSRAILADITYRGYPALLSAGWYLDHLSTGGDWRNFYECDPHDFPGTTKQKQLVIGGEACMWSEVVDNANVLQRIFPRVSAAAEKLWSPLKQVLNADDAAPRIEEHACRMKLRGIPAQPPNGPGFCI